MKGEDPETTYLEDALHWRSVYEELLSFKLTLIDLTETKIEDMPEAAALELESTDEVVLEAEHKRLQHRMDFWDQRIRELQAEAKEES